jgi:glycine betaine/proline transport system permease protein
MIGCTRRQMTWKVLVPSARHGLMVGVNQVIMLSLNMVIIASMIGAGGLGFDVLTALRRLDIGAGIEAGVAIVVLAIALDRLSQAYAGTARCGAAPPRSAARSLQRRYPYLLSPWPRPCGGLAGLVLARDADLSGRWTVTTGTFWGEVVRWINVNFFDALEAFKNLLLLNVLIPVKRFLGELPWIGGGRALGARRLALGGWRLALLWSSVGADRPRPASGRRRWSRSISPASRW